MGKHHILIASNRGPVSFALSDDGRLTARRGGGGLVSGLSSVVGSDADVLWICAALTDADRAAARHAPGGRLDLDGHKTGAAVQMLDIPAVTFHRAYNGVANSTLWFVHHLLYDMPNRPHFGLAWQREWESYRSYNAAFAAALAAAARRGDRRDRGRHGQRGRPQQRQGARAGLPPHPGTADAQRCAARAADRALLAYAVGTA